MAVRLGLKSVLNPEWVFYVSIKASGLINTGEQHQGLFIALTLLFISCTVVSVYSIRPASKLSAPNFAYRMYFVCVTWLIFCNGGVVWFLWCRNWFYQYCDGLLVSNDNRIEARVLLRIGSLNVLETRFMVRHFRWDWIYEEWGTFVRPLLPLHGDEYWVFLVCVCSLSYPASK